MESFFFNNNRKSCITGCKTSTINPQGFTVSQFGEAAGNTRKHALPLLNYLDENGITRRRENVRIAGPRLQVEN